jgi:biopolymer transport protein ExbD
MTPMIDVVFLLIIFFLVSSHLAKQETRLPLELPLASTHRPTDPEQAPLTISIDRDARIHVAGNVVEIDAIAAILAELRRSQGSQAAIRIRTDGAVQYRYVEPVLREAALVGVTDASIAVRQEGTP